MMLAFTMLAVMGVVRFLVTVCRSNSCDWSLWGYCHCENGKSSEKGGNKEFEMHYCCFCFFGLWWMLEGVDKLLILIGMDWRRTMV